MSLRNIISRSPIHQGSFRSIQLQSAVPEKIHTHPMKGHWKFLGGGGVRSQILEAKYEARLEFPGGKGVQNKQPSMGGGGGELQVMALNNSSARCTKFNKFPWVRKILLTFNLSLPDCSWNYTGIKLEKILIKHFGNVSSNTLWKKQQMSY